MISFQYYALFYSEGSWFNGELYYCQECPKEDCYQFLVQSSVSYCMLPTGKIPFSLQKSLFFLPITVYGSLEWQTRGDIREIILPELRERDPCQKLTHVSTLQGAGQTQQTSHRWTRQFGKMSVQSHERVLRRGHLGDEGSQRKRKCWQLMPTRLIRTQKNRTNCIGTFVHTVRKCTLCTIGELNNKSNKHKFSIIKLR